MDWGILLGVVGVFGIPLALAILGLTMAATTPGEFRFIRACFIAAAVISAVTVFLLQWNYTEGIPAVRIGTIAILGAMIFGGLAASLDWLNHKQNPPKQGTDNAIEGSVFVEVQNLTPLPEVYPSDGRIEVLLLSSEQQLLNGDSTGTRRVVTSIKTGIPGSKIDWPKPQKPSQWGIPSARLEITNDAAGGGTLFDLTLPIRVGLGMAPNNKAIDSNLILIRLDSGASNRRSLYVANLFGESIGVTFGNMAFAHKSDEAVMRPVRVGGSLSNPVASAIILFVLPDFPKPVEVPAGNKREAPDSLNNVPVVKSPPAPPPQAPAPPNTQEKK